MKRSLLIDVSRVGGALFVRYATRGCRGFDVEKIIERMPENAAPKWMFGNISAIRKNTERILELLEIERTHACLG